MRDGRRSVGARCAIGAGLALFLASMFLPATDAVESVWSKPGAPLKGWEASWVCVLVLNPILWVAEPRALLLLTIPLMNLALLFGTVAALALPESGLRVGVALVSCGILTAFFPRPLVEQLYVGFYVWVASFFVVGVGCAWLGWADAEWVTHGE